MPTPSAPGEWKGERRELGDMCVGVRPGERPGVIITPSPYPTASNTEPTWGGREGRRGQGEGSVGSVCVGGGLG